LFLSRPFEIEDLFEHKFKNRKQAQNANSGLTELWMRWRVWGGGGDITKLEAYIESLEKDLVSILQGLFPLFETRLHAFVVTM
jgi:hypothetical protein